MEEQRIKALEEEFKVLKNQIKAVLLDIKEQLATGSISVPSGAFPAGAVSAAIPQEENEVKVVPEPDSREKDLGTEDEGSPDLEHMLNRRGIAGLAGRNSDIEGRVDLLTVSVLSQWLSRAATSVNKAQICKLVEIYDITGNLPPRMKQVILLLADLYSNGNHAGDNEIIPVAESMQLLIELDSLLRYRTGALESVVLSMLLDKGQRTRKGG
jgi:hypothetical protein